MSDCPFCARIAAGEFDYFSASNVAFQPLNPVTTGHFLVVPRRHVSHALESPSRAASALAFAGYLANQMDLTDANFITSAGRLASQTVFHLHVHVVPRRPGDGLALPWLQDPKCGYCYCRFADAPECADGCAHWDLSGHVGCAGPLVPPSSASPRRSGRSVTRKPGGAA